MWMIILQSDDNRIRREEEDQKPTKSTIEYWERYHWDYSYKEDGSRLGWVVTNIYEVEDGDL